ncbi:MAG: hypothetical protein JSV39_00660 [Candidatus Aenigmatarchaeota archaeon]|nr:MAG: hypothetical protein JSV39_00660 [Candidatus Aenigmarchaeota archaeon]
MVGKKYEMDLTVHPNEFTIDEIPTHVRNRKFDGKDIPLEIIFKSPKSKIESHERGGYADQIHGFNGTCIFTPAGPYGNLDIGVFDIVPGQLEGDLAVVNLEKGVSYGTMEIAEALREAGITDKYGKPLLDRKYIVLFETGLMDKILKITDKDGIPDFKKLEEIQKDSPGITEDGAEFLKFRDLAKSYAIDNISYETSEGSKNGFQATQLLMNVKTEKRKFTPLVYQVGKSKKPEFYQIVKKGNGYAAIGLGNPPHMKGLASWPVSFNLKSYR